MRRIVLALAVFAAVAVVVFVVVQRRADPGAPVAGLRAVGDEPFGNGTTISGAAVNRAVLTDGGTRLAVVTDDGLAIADDGRLRAVTAPGTKVVDAAWFGNGATLLVAEGPVPTGLLAVVDADGRVRGSIRLSPSVGFGTGHGMVVLPGGKRAVVTAVERPPLAAEQRHLVLVDLETGATSALTETGGPDEAGPVVVDDGRLAFTSTAPDGSSTAALVELSTGAVETLAAPGSVVGAAEGTVVVAAAGEVVAVTLDGADLRRRRLAAIPDGQRVVAADPLAGEGVLLDRTGRLHRLQFDAVTIPR